MHQFFDLPTEIILAIFDKTALTEQARLAQVCRKFNGIANDNTLKLFEYKSKNKRLEIGDICLRIIEMDFEDDTPDTHFFVINKQGDPVPDSLMSLSPNEFHNIAESMSNGVKALVKTLYAMGRTSAAKSAHIIARSHAETLHSRVP